MNTEKKFVLAMLISLIILIYFPFVNATCSLGASPLEMSANAKPGQTVEITWNFFNLRGDRPTHVLISKDSGADWEITYNPAAENKSYEVAGIITNSLENFAMDKSEIVTTKPEPLPAGKVAYVVHPNSSLGYILVEKQMKILITLPDDAKIGEAQNFVFTALGKCFGETGSVAASLATELKVKITPSTDYYEKPVGETASVGSLGKKIIGLFDNIKPVYMISTGLTLILIIVLVVLVVLARRKQIKKGIKEEAKILGIRKRRR